MEAKIHFFKKYYVLDFGGLACSNLKERREKETVWKAELKAANFPLPWAVKYQTEVKAQQALDSIKAILPHLPLMVNEARDVGFY
jgi:hypothetical protein